MTSATNKEIQQRLHTIIQSAIERSESILNHINGLALSGQIEKLGEEAVEAVIAAVSNDRGELIKESADVLFHLLVVLKIADIPLAEVMAELENRTSQSGIVEKASRSSG